MMPGMAAAVLEHVQKEECRWQRWMLPRTVWEVEQAAKRVGQHTFMHTHPVPLLAFSEITIIHYTDLLPECSPTAASAGLSVFHSGLESICPLPPDFRLSPHSPVHFHHRPPFYYSLQCNRQWSCFNPCTSVCTPQEQVRVVLLIFI